MRGRPELPAAGPSCPVVTERLQEVAQGHRVLQSDPASRHRTHLWPPLLRCPVLGHRPPWTPAQPLAACRNCCRPGVGSDGGPGPVTCISYGQGRAQGGVSCTLCSAEQVQTLPGWQQSPMPALPDRGGCRSLEGLPFQPRHSQEWVGSPRCTEASGKQPRPRTLTPASSCCASRHRLRQEPVPAAGLAEDCRGLDHLGAEERSPWPPPPTLHTARRSTLELPGALSPWP